MFAYSNKKNFLVEFCMFNEETTQGNFDRSRSMDYGGNIKRITTHKTWLLYMAYYSKFSGWFTSILRNQYSNWCIEFYKLYKLDSCEEFEGQWTQVMEKYDILTVGAEAQNLCVLGFGLVIAQIGKCWILIHIHKLDLPRR